jgi:hypothetical protein
VISIPTPKCDKEIKLLLAGDESELCFKSNCVSLVVNLPYGAIKPTDIDNLNNLQIWEKVKGVLKSA